METDGDLMLKVNSPLITKLFNFKIEESSSNVSFSKCLLSDFDPLVESIRSLSRTIKLKKTFPDQNDEKVDQGTVFVFEVEVVCEKNELKVIEKDPAKKDKFFEHRTFNCVKVILIYSESVRVIEAKIKVYEEYEPLMKQTNIFLHHHFEECDSICKASGKQKLSSLFERITKMKSVIPLPFSLETVLQRAFQETLSEDNIRNLCNHVDVYDRGHPVGTMYGSAYKCYSNTTVQRIKQLVVKKTFKEIAKSLASDISYGILKNIENSLQRELEIELSNLEPHVSDEIHATFTEVIFNILTFFFDSVSNIVVAIFTFFSTIVMTVDVNSSKWRAQVAQEIHRTISPKTDSIYQKVFDQITKKCAETRGDLNEVLTQIRNLDKKLTLPDQEELLKVWKKREVVEDIVELRKRYPCILTYIAGNRNGSPFVKVFLKDNNKEAEAYFRMQSNIASIDFVNVTANVKGRSESLKGRRKQAKKATLRDNYIREDLRRIQKLYEDKLMAKHSNIIGIGVGKDMHKDTPCIVIYCLDKTLIPFGEEELPEELDDCPVDIREDFIMHGHCTNNRHSLHNGCSIGRPFCDSAGSVGFFVGSKIRPSEPDIGFLTAAHVALEDDVFKSLYEDGNLRLQNDTSASTHDIVHPSRGDSKKCEKIGSVADACYGNFGQNKTGIDAAFVKLNKPNLEDPSEIQIAEDIDLIPFETRVAKTGRTTGHTVGLYEGRFTICLPQSPNNNMCIKFKDCFCVIDDDEDEDEDNKTPFFDEGDSGSGVFLIDSKGQAQKALGIAFAFSTGYHLTLVCDIQNVVDVFNVAVYKEQNPVSVFQEQEDMDIAF